MSAKKWRLEKKISDRLSGLEVEAIRLRKVLQSIDRGIPKSYKVTIKQYNRLLIAANRQGIESHKDYSVVDEAFEPYGFFRLTTKRVADAFAAKGDGLALKFNDCMETGFRGGFSGSEAYHYIVDNKIFEKMVTRTLKQTEYRDAILSLSSYLTQAA